MADRVPQHCGPTAREVAGRDLAGSRILVLGAGIAGASAARYLIGRAAAVTICDDRQNVTAPLVGLGARAVTAADLVGQSWDDVDLVIASPGFTPQHPAITAARSAGVPVWGEVELAWRVDQSGLYGPPRRWLVITGTNGKTTTTGMVEAICVAGGESVIACGNIGLPVLDALLAEPRNDVLAVELSSFQLFWAPSIRPTAGVVLNIAEDHLDWHGSMAAYAEAKSGALQGDIAVMPVGDPVVVAMSLPAATRRIEFGLVDPAPGQFGVHDDMLTDRAFAAAQPLAAAGDIRPTGPAGTLDALAAAALCRSIGVSAEAVADGLTRFRVAAHRGEVVATRDGIRYADDSKATNPHAAQSAIAAYRRVIWLAGGLLKGAAVDDLVLAMRDRLAGVVLFGEDSPVIAKAIARHAPDVPTVTVVTRDDGSVNAQDVMSRAVQTAADLGEQATDRPDAILLAPAAASFDMFTGYAQRGEMFAAAARALPGAQAVEGLR